MKGLPQQTSNQIGHGRQLQAKKGIYHGITDHAPIQSIHDCQSQMQNLVTSIDGRYDQAKENDQTMTQGYINLIARY